MSSDIYSEVDKSRKIRFTKKEPEDRTEWEEREVNIYQTAEDVGDYYMVSQPQEKDQQVHSPPADNKCPARSAKLCKTMLWILMLCTIIILAIYFPLENKGLKKSNSLLQIKLLDMAANNTQLEAKLLDVAANNSQLQESYEILRKNQSQLIDELNKLKNHIKGTWCPDGWTRFGCSCYCKFEEKKSWSDSRKHCQDRGADLVIIDSQDEQDFVKKLNKNGESWIGLQSWRIETTWTWRWVDGSAVTQTFWAAGWPKYTDYETYATCCNDEGKWKHKYHDSTNGYNYIYNNWICEK